MPLLIKRLGLAGHAGVIYEERHARRTMLQEALAYLGRRRSTNRYESEVFEELMRTYQRRLDAVPSDPHGAGKNAQSGELRREALLEVTEMERATLLHLRNEDRIDDEGLRLLHRKLNLIESRIHTSAA